MNISVGIIEDEKDLADSLRLIINGAYNCVCAHVFYSAEDAIRSIPSLQLHVVLTDIHLPGKSGIDCIRELKPLCPQTAFLICTAFEDNNNVFNALKAGAVGYLTKTTRPAQLVEAIIDVYNGGSPMNSHIARKVVSSFNSSNTAASLELLTPRERDILSLLTDGFRYKEIANKLFLSTETVRTHIRNIYGKLQVNSRTDAINKVFRS